MSIFSNLDDSSVFKNEDVLSTEHVPVMLPHREDQVRQIARNLLPVSKGRKPQNMFIYGSPGIGKTAVVKNVFREFENYSESVKCVYINCWDFRTTTALLTQLILEMGMFVQRRGWSKDEIVGKLIEAVKKGLKGVVVCLDEVDQLDTSALYDLLRINQYVKTPLGLVCISNNSRVFAEVEPRIKSSMDMEEIEFKPYNFSEMKDILDERAKEAFRSYESAVVTLCANHAVKKGGDVRIGLQCLLKAGRCADSSKSSKVCVAHAKDIVKSVQEAKPQILKERISEHEKILLTVLEDGKKWPAGKLYERYCELAEKEGVFPVTDRALRKFVNHMNEIGLVEISEKKVGKSRLIWKA